MNQQGMRGLGDVSGAVRFQHRPYVPGAENGGPQKFLKHFNVYTAHRMHASTPFDEFHLSPLKASHNQKNIPASQL